MISERAVFMARSGSPDTSSGSESGAVIATTALRKRFGRVDTIEGVDLQVPEGTVFALIGPNGAGKTTTIRLLMNILQPDSGSITVLGTPSRALGWRHFQHIGYVSESQKLPEALSITQYFRYLQSLYANWDSNLERELCEQFELPPARKLKHLSHGMRMKTLLVAALAYRPKLLVLDEPLSGLDTLVRDEVVNGLLQQAENTTILISSHELTEIEHFITHVAFMQNGRLLLQESIDSLQGRFREVSVTLSAQRALPDPLPADWLLPQIEGHRLRFVTSAFADDAQLYRQLTQWFGAVKVSVEPLPLRNIANTLMQARKRTMSGHRASQALS
jgi:ABC-2 type transport system ATP-binding protein